MSSHHRDKKAPRYHPRPDPRCAKGHHHVGFGIGLGWYCKTCHADLEIVDGRFVAVLKNAFTGPAAGRRS